jgi:LDH2 family malate/lactate/ureidoglycolate dehydrogenase
VTDARRYRLDDLRRFGSALAVGAGVADARAPSLVNHLLWFDAAGASSFGIQTLPSWLDRIDERRVDPRAEGKVERETIGTAVLDGQNGIAPLILARAGELATEKARDAGVGIVRVTNVGPLGPSACVAAEMAVGPVASFVMGPERSWSLAVPSLDGLPAVYDSALAGGGVPASDGARAAAPDAGSVLPWAWALIPEGGWLIMALAIKAIEPLPSFVERVGASLDVASLTQGQLLPSHWEARRRDVREHGVAVEPSAWAALTERANRFGVPCPNPFTTAATGSVAS